MMFFELTNASANFQSYIYLTLCEYLNIFCIVYFNDILINSDDKNTHELASEVKTIRLRQHIYVQSRHRISLEEQTQRRRENAKTIRNDLETSSDD